MVLPWPRFWAIVEIIGESQEKESRERMIAGAFTAWLLGAAPDLSFRAYIGKLRLTEKHEQPRAVTKDEALADADRIVQLVKRRHRKGR